MTKREIMEGLGKLSNEDFWEVTKTSREERITNREKQGMKVVEVIEGNIIEHGLEGIENEESKKDAVKERVRDVSKEKRGYDIKSERNDATYYIEVKGLWHTNTYIYMTEQEISVGNKILRDNNSKEKFILAVVKIEEKEGKEVVHSVIYYSGIDFGDTGIAEIKRVIELEKLPKKYEKKLDINSKYIQELDINSID